MKYVTTIGELEFNVELVDDRKVIVDGKEYEVDFDALSDQPVVSLLVDGQSYEAYVYQADDSWHVLMLGRFYPAIVEDEREKRLRAATASSTRSSGEYQLKAPMPGLVIDVPVSEGQDVDKGDVLLILESMKMQNELKSPKAGTIRRVRINPGDSVEQHQIMLSIV